MIIIIAIKYRYNNSNGILNYSSTEVPEQPTILFVFLHVAAGNKQQELVVISDKQMQMSVYKHACSLLKLIISVVIRSDLILCNSQL